LPGNLLEAYRAGIIPKNFIYANVFNVKSL